MTDDEQQIADLRLCILLLVRHLAGRPLGRADRARINAVLARYFAAPTGVPPTLPPPIKPPPIGDAAIDLITAVRLLERVQEDDMLGAAGLRALHQEIASFLLALSPTVDDTTIPRRRARS